MAVALLILWLMPSLTVERVSDEAPLTPVMTQVDHGRFGTGFRLLLAIGVLDSSVGVGLLLFLPALLQAKGGSPASLGLALSLVFVGGACGKAACGWLGARLGLLATVVVTEIGTTATIMALLALPLVPGLVLLPFLGVMLNGTSSVLYGTVPDLTSSRRIEHAFAVFYSCTLGASAAAPVLYGRLGDTVGPFWAVAAAGLTALLVVPFMVLLSPLLVLASHSTRA